MRRELARKRKERKGKLVFMSMCVDDAGSDSNHRHPQRQICRAQKMSIFSQSIGSEREICQDAVSRSDDSSILLFHAHLQHAAKKKKPQPFKRLLYSNFTRVFLRSALGFEAPPPCHSSHKSKKLRGRAVDVCGIIADSHRPTLNCEHRRSAPGGHFCCFV